MEIALLTIGLLFVQANKWHCCVDMTGGVTTEDC